MAEETLRVVRGDIAAFGACFYGRLFDAHPELRELFRRPVREQSHHLVNGLAAILKSFRSRDQVEVLLGALASVHVGYGVRAEHYPIMGHHLVAALCETLGPRWTREHECAWRAVYARILRSVCGLVPAGDGEEAGSDGFGIDAPLDVLGMAAEYLRLCRRWRDADTPFTFEELDRWRSLRRHLDAALGRHGPHPGRRRRRWLRVPTLLEASFSTRGDGAVSALLTEVAERGLFIASDQPLPPGTPIRVELLPEEGARPLAVRGRVVWVRPPGTRGPEPAGMGVYLDELNGVDEQAMIDLVERCLYLELRALQPARASEAAGRG